MRKLMRILVGYRDDVILSEHWWHRLFTVAGVLLMAAAALIIATTLFARIQPTEFNIRVITTLKDVTERLPRGSSINSVPLFLKENGNTGVRNYDHTISVLADDTISKLTCTRENDNIADSTQKSPPRETMRASISDITAVFIPNDSSSGFEHQYCAMPTSTYTPFALIRLSNAAQVIKWRYRPTVFCEVLLDTSCAITLLLMVAMNIYYRGLIYIMFGRRRYL